jgi:hypothetical protein
MQSSGQELSMIEQMMPLARRMIDALAIQNTSPEAHGGSVADCLDLARKRPASPADQRGHRF